MARPHGGGASGDGGDEDVADDVPEGDDGATAPAGQDRSPDSGQGTKEQRGQGTAAKVPMEIGTGVKGRGIVI